MVSLRGAGEMAVTGGDENGIGRMGIPKHAAFAGQAVQVGSLHPTLPGRSYGIKTLLVGHQQQDIRSLVAPLHRNLENNREAGQRQ